MLSKRSSNKCSKIYTSKWKLRILLKKSREKAWNQLLSQGLPTRKAEVFQYIRLRTLYTKHFVSPSLPTLQAHELDSSILPECSQSTLVLVNGHYCPHLSRLSAIPKRLVILPLHEAARTYGSFLNNQWNKILAEETDPFALLNAALYKQGIFIYAPPKTQLEVPLQILHVSQANDQPMIMTPRVQDLSGPIPTQFHFDSRSSFSNQSLI